MSPTVIESGAAVGKFSPVEVDVGEEEIADGDEHQIQGKRALGHVEVARDRVWDAGDEEVQGEDVGADHPLAVRGELTVAAVMKAARVQRNQTVDMTELAKGMPLLNPWRPR